VLDALELAYLLVYAVVPAGAAALLLSGHAPALARFWAAVLASVFACYGMLPWLQTRPPRAIEPHDPFGDRSLFVRRLNLAVLAKGSIQVNTVPSGHAAGAVAVAFAVGSAMPLTGLLFAALAFFIALATVVGRYHYVLDTLAGVLVALVAWAMLG
jgi:membrane-associated phospholipid phosphatase